MTTTSTAAPRGTLRVYLGAAPGVGKTYAMLAEGQRRRARGTDVVAALVETHGRRLTSAMTEGLETVPRRTMSYRGAAFTEMDLDAVLARHPQVALVDELAHTNVPGCRNAKRWQDVEELLDAGIEVITTLNIQHLESLSDVTRQITGVEQHETLPDEIARRADQIELVDMTPEALRRRMMHGNVYPPDRIDAALTHYFRPGNLTGLRELALLWVADRVEEGLQRYRAQHGIAAQWETRERIVVGIAGDAGDEAVIRRAARIAARTPGSDLLAVHVTRDDGLSSHPGQALAAQRALVASLGGTAQEVPGDDVAEALLQFARAQDATQMVLGASRRSRLTTLLAGKSIPTRLARRAGHIDVHLVSRKGIAARRRTLATFRHRTPARRAAEEAAALTRLAVSVLSGHGDPPALLEEIREMLGLASISLLEQRPNGTGQRWYVMASAGDQPPDAPAADVSLPVTGTVVLAGRGRPLTGDDARLLSACAVPMVAGLIRRRQDEQDAHAAWQAADSHSRAALLAATGQQAREQLQKADAALAALADPATAITPGERAARAADARRAIARISLLLTDLGDLRRLQAGALETYLRAVGLDEVLAAALEDLGPGGPPITLSLPEDLPDFIADAGQLTRILTSLIAEALHRSPPGQPPALTAASHDGHAEIRITDHGPPQAEGSEPDMLGFRLARDLTEAMGDTLRCEHSADGGRTVVIMLPAAASVKPEHTASAACPRPSAEKPTVHTDPVAEVDVARILTGTSPEVEPAEELAGRPLLRRPRPEPVELLVDGEVEGDDLVPQRLQRRRRA
ncbi:MAG TPA: universal stress protein [Trebonia sp.]|nr:universal stress protein [Trebonia sp.]